VIDPNLSFGGSGILNPADSQVARRYAAFAARNRAQWLVAGRPVTNGKPPPKLRHYRLSRP
jgi:hypothetical protein